MYIRQTKTRGSIKGESYFTYRLVASERVGSQVRQKTLLNLGSTFSLSKDEWPLLCSCIERNLSSELVLIFESDAIEKLAALYSGRLIAASAEDSDADSGCDYQEVDTNSLELSRPRSVAVAETQKESVTSRGFGLTTCLRSAISAAIDLVEILWKMKSGS